MSDPSAFPRSLLLVGAGKMGGALLDGWLADGFDAARVAIVDPHGAADVLQGFADRGVTVNAAEPSRPAPEVLVLAIKPQALDGAGASLAPLAGPETLVVSVVAGKTIADLQRAFPQAQAFARAMPNTPAAVRRGITGVAVNTAVSSAQRVQLGVLLGAVGAVEWLADESLIDAVTAVSGSGPAYVFYLTECLAKAGEAVGLDATAAMRLARATVEGAGALMAASPEIAPETLRRNVSSPGGTTAAAIAVLETEGRLAAAMKDAVTAARRRAAELAG